jgi:RHS repeat-associated protein
MTNLRSLLLASAATLILVATAQPSPPTYCGPTTSVVDAATASTFVSFASNERLEVRGGRPGAADWEWGLGINTQSAGSFQNINNIDWPNGTSGGQPIRYTLTYNADGSGVITLFSVLANGTTGNQLATRTFAAPTSPATGLRVGNAIRVWVKSNAGIGEGAKIRGVIEEIDGVVLPSPISMETLGDNTYSEQVRVFSLAPPTNAGTLAVKGTFQLSWVASGSTSASAIPTGSRLNATINAGTITCGSTTVAQTISGLTTTPTAPLTYAPAPNNTATVSATGGASGNPVVFASTSPAVCTVSSSTVGANNLSTATLTILSAGTCTLTADQAGGTVNGTTYTAAPQVTSSIVIGKASQTISLAPPPPATVTYSPTAPGNTITLTATASSGLPVSFASTSPSVCTTSTASASNSATLTIASAGTCTVTADQPGNENINAAPQVTASITVNKASQTITGFNPPTTISQAVGSTLALTATGGASGNPVTFSTTTPSVCTVSGNSGNSGGTSGATLTVQASGSCSVAANQAGNDNYNAATPVSVTISIAVPAQLYFIHADHLGTPRAITKASDNTKVWEWRNDDPFGNNTPDESPSGANAAAFKYNLRFPGQYFDEETNTHYNYFRDYEPSTGRYTQSDPIGLRGGLNTFGYVNSMPLAATDPKGLVKWEGTVFTLGARVFAGEIYSLISECVNGRRARVEVRAVGSGPGAGATVGGSFASFDDSQRDIDPNVFNGVYGKTGAGLSLGIGYQCGRTQLGLAVSAFSCGVQGGLDYSIGTAWGVSKLAWVRYENCDGCDLKLDKTLSGTR